MGAVIGSAGPTTSGRMDSYTQLMLDCGLAGTIGKGPRNEQVNEAIKRTESIYFAALGGAGALCASHITACTCVCYEDLASEAVYRLTIKDMPLTVAVYTHGNDIYSVDSERYLKR